MKLITITTLVLSLLCCSCQQKKSERRTQEPYSNAVSKEWYEGGTLHKTDGTEWRKATDQNKLATCADFTMTLAQKAGETPQVRSQKFKVASESLKDCIDRFFELPESEQTSVSKAAIQCWTN